jgi:hypothetical protein
MREVHKSAQETSGGLAWNTAADGRIQYTSSTLGQEGAFTLPSGNAEAGGLQTVRGGPV